MSDAPRGDTPSDATNEPRRPLISPVILTTVILAVLIAGGAWGWVWWSERNTSMPPIANPPIAPGSYPAEEEEDRGPTTRPATRPSARATTRVGNPPTTVPARESRGGQAR